MRAPRSSPRRWGRCSAPRSRRRRRGRGSRRSVLQETIEQPDVRPPQVLLEVLIAEVTLDKASQYGINWQVLTQRGVAGDSTRGIGVGVGPQTFGDTLLQRAQGLGVRLVS